MGDFADAKVTLTVKTLVVVVGFVVGVVAASVFGYLRLDAKADAGVEAKESLAVLKCYVRQLNAYMIDGRRPVSGDDCERKGRLGDV